MLVFLKPAKINYFKHSFSIRIAQHYNNLPAELITESTSLNNF